MPLKPIARVMTLHLHKSWFQAEGEEPVVPLKVLGCLKTARVTASYLHKLWFQAEGEEPVVPFDVPGCLKGDRETGGTTEGVVTEVLEGADVEKRVVIQDVIGPNLEMGVENRPARLQMANERQPGKGNSGGWRDPPPQRSGRQCQGVTSAWLAQYLVELETGILRRLKEDLVKNANLRSLRT